MIPSAHKIGSPVLDRSRSGVAAIEAAIILPVLLLLATGVFDLGSAAYENMQVQSAADAGAHYASRNTWNVAAIQVAVTGATGGSGIAANPAPFQFCACPTGGTLTTVACASTCSTGDPPGLYARVSAQKLHSPVLSYPGLPKPLTLSADAVARLP
jgi:Flp pilus assembly protein TadG